MRLRSADPEDHPRILNNMLTADSEVEACLRAIDLVRELAGTAPLASRLGEELNPGSGIRDRGTLTAWLRATTLHLFIQRFRNASKKRARHSMT